MKEMKAKTYLETIARICDREEAAGRCCTKDDEDGGISICPLFCYSCGAPRDKEDIKAVLRIAADYKEPPKGACWNCGADIRDLRETQKIKYCPFCGEGVRENK